MEKQLTKIYEPLKVWLLVGHAAIGSLIFSYNIGVFTSSQPSVSASLNWGEDSDLYIALMSSFLQLGAMFGALFSGYFSHFIGRRTILMLADSLIILSSIVTILPSTFTFASGRILSGFAVGMFSMQIPLYITEFSPSDISGKLGTLMMIFGCIGSLFAFSFALALPTENYDTDPMNEFWVLMFLFPGLMASIQLSLFILYFKNESPLWLLQKGRTEEALNSLEFVYKKEFIEQVMGKITEEEESGEKNEFSYLSFVCCHEVVKKAMRIGLMLSVVQQLSGINAILSYATTIFGQFGSGVFIARVLTMVSALVKVTAAFLLMPFIDKVGRKKTLIFGCVGMSISLFLIGLLSNYTVHFIFPFLLTELYLSLFVSSIGPICWIYSGEILTSRGMSICTATNWFTSFIVVLLFPFLILTLGQSGTFFIFAFVNLIGSFYFAFDMIETKGLNKSEIKVMFSKINNK